MRSELLNGGAYCRTAFQAINKTATAGGAGDATEVDGAYVDRQMDELGQAMSAKLVIAYTATLAAGATLSFGVQMQDDADGSGAGTDYGDAIASTAVAEGESGGSTETGTVEIDIDLAGAQRHIRSQITPNLSAGATDTCEWSAVLVLFGHSRQPSSQKIGTVGGVS